MGIEKYIPHTNQITTGKLFFSSLQQRSKVNCSLGYNYALLIIIIISNYIPSLTTVNNKIPLIEQKKVAERFLTFIAFHFHPLHAGCILKFVI